MGNRTLENSQTHWELLQRVQICRIPEDRKHYHGPLIEWGPLLLSPVVHGTRQVIFTYLQVRTRINTPDILLTLDLPIHEHGINFILHNSSSLHNVIVSIVEIIYTFC